MPSALIQAFRDFLEASPTAFHAVDAMAAELSARGARRLREREAWELEPGAAYYVERGGSALIAFRPGLRPPAEAGFALAGAHTDSPALKARLEKPLSGRGIERVPVEIYGAPIVSTWLDRPLSLAGRVALRAQGSGQVETRLVDLARPIGLIPNLAVHLNRDMNKGVEYNAQGQLPVLVAAGLSSAKVEDHSAKSDGPSWLACLVAAELRVEPDSILGADLFFVDAQGAVVFGPDGDLLNAYRLDDLAGCHAILEAFLDASPSPHGQVACFLDGEEVGSRTPQGADSSWLRDLLGRICALAGCRSEEFYRALASSFCVSVDAAQAWHPSYSDKYDEAYTPLLGGGPAIKSNALFKYATDAETEARFRVDCAEAGFLCQKFMARADMTPGSTIGPLSSSHTGIATVDIGAPLLSMHSIRETVSLRDHEAMIAVLGAHFRRSPGGEP